VLGTANDQGEFSLRVEPGDYALRAVAEGYYGTAPVAVSVNEGETREISLTAAVLGTNVAGTARAVASSEAAGAANGAANVTDGDPGTVWLAKEYANQGVALAWDRPAHRPAAAP